MKFPEKYRNKFYSLYLKREMNYFKIPFKGRNLNVFADKIAGYEHVSVSLPNRNPNWDEMCFVKDLFWDEEEMCIQFHPKKSQYVNLHSHCLHIWKPCDEVIELLEKQMVIPN